MPRNLILAAALMSMALWGCRAKPTPEERPIPVTGFVAQRVQIPTVIDVSGKISPQNQVLVYSSVPGKVIEVLASEGDRVVRDRALARVIQDLPGSDYRPHQVVSPIAGVVIRALASQGATITPQTPLFEVADDRCINFVGQLFGEDRGRIRKGQRLLVSHHGDTLFDMSITRISPLVDPVSGGQEIEARVCLIKNPVLIGQSVDGLVITGSLSGIAVPRNSLVKDSLGQEGVYLLDQGRAAFQPVRVINRAEEYFLVEGLEPGLLIAADGAADLSPGSKVGIR